jgi:isopentenyl diphosphate isomerase/L-lactate dehydrogenase-like FMN-dependent dehydrogenase
VGAKAANATYLVSNPNWMGELDQAGQSPTWWGSTLGHASRQQAVTWAQAQQDAGAVVLAVTVDHPFTPNRDRNIRYGFPGYEAGVLRPGTPGITWDYLEWMRAGSNLPLVVKGILTGEDAELAVEHGAQGIIVSNHGGRALDGAMPTLMALPECVDAVGGRIPVMIDGGIRRGGDVLKALALGATAVLIGRPYVWGLAAFGPVGVQRVVELLHAEFKVAMGLAGASNLASIGRDMVSLPWEHV